MTPKPLLALPLVLTSAALTAQHPIVPGVQRLRAHASSTAAERGTVLLGELSCTACHDPRDEGAHLPTRRSPDLSRLSSRVTTSWLERYLLDPRGTKPGSLMPHWLPGIDAAARKDLVKPLVHYLVSRSKPLPASNRVADTARVERGRQLYHSVGCVACHAPDDDRKTDVSSVPLGPLAHKTTIEALTEFLLDPQAVRPASRMPQLWLEKSEAEDIARYLLREQSNNPQADGAVPPQHAGLFYEFFPIEKPEMPDFAERKPTTSGFVDSVTNRIDSLPLKSKYALRFRGEINLPDTGAYTFYLRSHGEARLLIDGNVVIADGVKERSGLEELEEGQHEIEIEYFHFRGKKELSAHWSVPGGRKRPIQANAFSNRRGRAMIPLESPAQPFVVDRDLAKRGRQVFEKLRCAACHEPGAGAGTATPLAKVDPSKLGSCLDSKPTAGAVQFDLSGKQTADLRAALTDQAWARKPGAAAQARADFASFNCYACHAREGIGSPEAAREEFFETKISIDLGDEGRFPPPLDGVGDKLRPEILAAVVKSGKHHIRGRFMKTRMPGFASEQTDRMVKTLITADRKKSDRTATPFSIGAAEVGKKIVGISGFACVTCHNVNGGQSAAIPGVDIATAGTRLNPDWFHRYLWSPPKFRPGTRMPAFWAEEKSPFTDLVQGSSSKQIDAIWSYLSLGKSIPMPAGIRKDDGRPKMELIPQSEPIVHRTFMKDVSQRAILVGFPENVHVAFDAQAVRLAKAWRGRFFDASGVASGRTQRAFGPLGGEELKLNWTAFAQLAEPATPWPSIADNARDVGGAFRGYTLDQKRRPSFRYELAGTLIREQPLPVLQPGGGVLQRVFDLTSAEAPDDLHFLAWRGKPIRKIGANTWVSGEVTIALRLAENHRVRIRPVGAEEELLVHIQFQNGKTRLEETIRW